MTPKEEAALLEGLRDLTERARAWRLELEAINAILGTPPNYPKGAPQATARRHLRAVASDAEGRAA